MIRTGALLSGSHSRNYQNIVRQICGSSLIGYWPLDEQTGTVAYDRSGNGRNGAHTGVTLLRPGVELLANGGFETAGAGGADVWGTWAEFASDGAIADEGTLVQTGSHAAKLTSGPTIAGCSISGAVVTVPWAGYNMGWYSRCGAGETAGIRYDLYNAVDWSRIHDYVDTGITGAAYTPYAASFTAPGGCTAVQLTLRTPRRNGGIAYFDDVSLTAAAPNGIRGATAPFYDGTNDFTNIYSAGLASAFNGAEGTLAIWARVSGAGVWTDGVARRVCSIVADSNNQIIVQKIGTANNRIDFRYDAGGVFKVCSVTGLSSTGWLALALTWCKTGDVATAYVNGVAQPGVLSSLGTWVGAIAETTSCIGAKNTVPDSVWSGLLNHAVLCNRALSAAEVARLYTAGLPLVA